MDTRSDRAAAAGPARRRARRAALNAALQTDHRRSRYPRTHATFPSSWSSCRREPFVVEASALHHPAGVAGMHGRSPLLRLQSDDRLIALVRRGNHHAFEALVARYQARLLAFCRHMLSSKEDAEDVLQEVFAAAFNAILADERAINVRPWLYRIARNRSLNHLRRTQADRRRLDGHPPLRARPDDRRQGPPARGVPAPDRRRAGAARDAAHRAAAAGDRRAVVRADRRGDGDDRPVGQVAARARPRVARRGRRGAAAVVRGGPPGARRGRRGADAHERPGAPPPAHLRALRDVPQAAARDQQGAGRAVPGRPAAPAQEDAARPPRHLGRRERRRRGRLGRRRRGRRAGRPQHRRHQGRRRPRRRRDRHRRRRRGPARAQQAARPRRDRRRRRRARRAAGPGRRRRRRPSRPPRATATSRATRSPRPSRRRPRPRPPPRRRPTRPPPSRSSPSSTRARRSSCRPRSAARARPRPRR